MERKSRKIGIIGHFGGKENILDGQTIKTKILHEELSKATDWKIIKVDTYYKKKNPIKLFIDTFKCLFSTKDIIVLLSGNGMKFYFPILSFFAQKFHTNIYHDVIGGNLDVYVSKYPKFKKYLNSFQINWVETAGMKDKLENQAIKNCEVMPNFKRLSIADREEEIEFSEPYRFCIFSRVMKEKYEKEKTFYVRTENLEDQIEYIKINGKKQNRKKQKKGYEIQLNEAKNYEIEVKAKDFAGNEKVSQIGFEIYEEKSLWQKIVEPVRKYIFYGNEKVIQDEKMVKEDKKEGKKKNVILWERAVLFGTLIVVGIWKREKVKEIWKNLS